MSKWLASVKSLEEAQILLSVLPDILDMKNPSEGALGALDVGTVSQIVNLINGRCQTSATIGDLPMRASLISAAIIEMASSGVDYVKIGLFPDDKLSSCIGDLASTIKNVETPIIGVIFADKPVKFELLPLLKSSGFHGIMVDTAIKNGQHLLKHWDLLKLSDFITVTHRQGMLCGLAGALRYEDIKTLQPLSADYLGFRSALCLQYQRTSTIDLTLAEQISPAIKLQAEPAMS